MKIKYLSTALNSIKKIGKRLIDFINQKLKSDGARSFYATLFAILLGMFFGFFVMLIASPTDVFYGFNAVITGGFERLGDVLYYATPILMTGLSVGFAFKMGLFNIGASGQYTMGMFFAIYVGLMWDMPGNIHWLVCVLAGLVGGMLWGLIPGVLKALLNVNEVITSIMTNYIGLYLVDMLVQQNGKLYDPIQVRTRYLPESAKLASLGVADSNLNIAFIIGIVIAIILFIILFKTTFGYELLATGRNKHASHYAGINYKRNTILTLVIAGGLAGLGGAFMILAPSSIEGSSRTYEPINVIAQDGFNGIAVALLGSSNPIGIIFSAIFISFIQRGGSEASIFGYKPEIIDVVVAVIIYFSAFALIMNTAVKKLFINIKNKIKKKKEDSDQIIEIKKDVKEA